MHISKTPLGSTSMDTTPGNSTCNYSTTGRLDNHKVEAGCVIGDGLLLCIFVGLGISQLAFAVVHYKELKNKRARSHCRSKDWMLKTAMDISMVLACILASLRGVVTFLPGAKDNETCDIQRKLQIGLYASSLFFTYSVLWLRQLSLYTNAFLRHLVTMVIRLASFSIFLLLLTHTLIILVVVMLFHRFILVRGGCIACPDIENHEIIIGIISTALFQFSLVSLFAYPLVKHRASCGTSKIKGVLRRIIAAAVVCILSDAFCGVFAIIHPHREVEVFIFAYYMNLLVHVLSVIFSFRAWRKRLLPCATLLKNRSYSPAAI